MEMLRFQIFHITRRMKKLSRNGKKSMETRIPNLKVNNKIRVDNKIMVNSKPRVKINKAKIPLARQQFHPHIKEMLQDQTIRTDRKMKKLWQNGKPNTLINKVRIFEIKC